MFVLMFSVFCADGFSPYPSIITYFPNVNDSNLPHHWDMQPSLDKTCPTILMDFESGTSHT